jgi:hypothetical protein
MTVMSWYLLPSGQLLPLTTTQDLLVELVPVVEDMAAARERVRSAVADCTQTGDEARRLIVRSRRQRLDLRLVATRDSTGQQSGME